MDFFLLDAVATEAAARLIEQEVLRVSCLGLNRYLLRFATRDRANLLISVRADRFCSVASDRFRYPRVL